MSPNLTLVNKGKKFMWDGQVYETNEEAYRVQQSYENDKFEVRKVEQDGKFLLYTRRTAEQLVATEP